MTTTGNSEEEQRDPAPGLFLLLSALQRLSFRAGEPGAWAAPLAEDPIAFLLDTVGELVNVWTTGGELVYSNHSASDPAELDGPATPGVTSYGRDGKRFERRALAFAAHRTTYVIEVVRELH
jgi:hypothetical protein